MTNEHNPIIRFLELYIPTKEICQRLNVSNTTVSLAVKNGQLPTPIRLGSNSTYIFERDVCEPYLQHWEESIKLSKKKKTGPRPDVQYSE